MALTKEDLTAINGLLEPLRTDMQALTGKVTALQDHVENETDRNIEALTEKVTALQDHVENETDRKIAELQDHVENETDRKIAELQDHVENETDRKIAELQDHVENETDRKLTALSLHIENETDKGLQLVAENHCALNDKLDQILVDHKTNTSFDVEISSLKARMSRLEERVKGITA